jgi:hypothetical protein
VEEKVGSSIKVQPKSLNSKQQNWKPRNLVENCKGRVKGNPFGIEILGTGIMKKMFSISCRRWSLLSNAQRFAFSQPAKSGLTCKIQRLTFQAEGTELPRIQRSKTHAFLKE